MGCCSTAAAAYRIAAPDRGYDGMGCVSSRLSLDGVAEDNYQVSDQLRALEAAPVLGVPVLSQVEGDEQGGRRFSLSVDQRLTASVEEAP